MAKDLTDRIYDNTNFQQWNPWWLRRLQNNFFTLKFYNYDLRLFYKFEIFIITSSVQDCKLAKLYEFWHWIFNGQYHH